MAYEPKQAIYLCTMDFLSLELFLIDVRPGVKPDEFVTDLVKRWIATETERLALRTNGRAMRGYQWKNVFLPDGTALRTKYGATVDFARVVGDQVVSADGEKLSPSLFANRHAKGRNAWRFVWLRFPGDEYWVLASDCRRRSEAQTKNTV